MGRQASDQVRLGRVAQPVFAKDLPATDAARAAVEHALDLGLGRPPSEPMSAHLQQLASLGEGAQAALVDDQLAFRVLQAAADLECRAFTDITLEHFAVIADLLDDVVGEFFI